MPRRQLTALIVLSICGCASCPPCPTIPDCPSLVHPVESRNQSTHWFIYRDTLTVQLEGAERGHKETLRDTPEKNESGFIEATDAEAKERMPIL
ncbi:MAG: hypothetical protein GY847_05535 [Proteobacteria bacterium]|nr:hypothetical protein [Pseudomonadota bacterium]